MDTRSLWCLNLLYNKALRSCIYLSMLAIAAQTAEPNWLIFFEGNHGHPGGPGGNKGSKIDFLFFKNRNFSSKLELVYNISEV